MRTMQIYMIPNDVHLFSACLKVKCHEYKLVELSMTWAIETQTCTTFSIFVCIPIIFTSQSTAIHHIQDVHRNQECHDRRGMNSLSYPAAWFDPRQNDDFSLFKQGTGNLGPYLVRSLLKAGFTVSVLSRSSASNANLRGATIVQSDYTHGSLVDVFTGQDAVVSALSTADVAEQNTIVDAVAAAKVKRFFPSEYGIDTSVEGLAESAAFLKGKQDVMNHVKSKEAEGLSWTAIFVGSFIDWVSPDTAFE